MDDWRTFNVFRVCKTTLGQPLVGVGYYIFHRFGLSGAFDIPDQVLVAFLRRVERAYRRSPHYHNALHAAECLATMAYLLLQDALGGHCTKAEVLATVVACLVHDVDHPGLNNDFLIRTSDPLAIRYNDSSVLENHHLATAWSILRREDCNIFARMASVQYRAVRDLIIKAVLHTDMRHHFELASKLKTRASTPSFSLENGDDRAFLLVVCVHAVWPLRTFRGAAGAGHAGAEPWLRPSSPRPVFRRTLLGPCGRRPCPCRSPCA